MCFYKARLSIGKTNKLVIQCLEGQESFKIKPLLQTNAWIKVPPQDKKILAGSMVCVFTDNPEVGESLC